MELGLGLGLGLLETVEFRVRVRVRVRVTGDSGVQPRKSRLLRALNWNKVENWRLRYTATLLGEKFKINY